MGGMEETPRVTGQEPSPAELAEKAFASYQRDFALSEEELRGSLIDVGAGAGHFVRYLRETLGNERAVGLDESPGRAEAYPAGVVFGSSAAILFPDGSFQTVIAHHYLPQFRSPGPRQRPATEHLAELLRAAAVGGTVRFDFDRLDASVDEIVDDCISDATPEEVADFRRSVVANVPGQQAVATMLESLRRDGAISFSETLPVPKHPTHAVYTLRKLK